MTIWGSKRRLKSSKLVGLDLGFGFAKGFDGQQPIIIPSILSDRGRPEAVPDVDPRAPGNGIHMMADGEVFFVGRLADLDWRSPTIPYRPDRLFGDYGKHAVLAVLSAYAEREIPLQVVIGLPVSHFQLLRQAFENRLLGYHQVAWVQADGSRVPRNIHIRGIHFAVHPMGTFCGLVMDTDGRMQPGKFKDQKVALVDIGFRSTDVIVMDRMCFSKRGSATIELGMGHGFEMIDRQLRRETGRRLRFNQLYQAVRLGHMRVAHQRYNLEQVREEAFRRLATELAGNIGHLLAVDWDLDRLLLTGGGSRDLAGYIAPLLPSVVSQIENEWDVRLNNVQGQFRLARSLWGVSDL